MGLGGGQAGRSNASGYAMAALLVALAVMAVLLSVAMPAWRHEAQREKEAELVWRGEQYARAIALYRAKNAQVPNALPPSIDVLVEGRFLRKKYKDPMTKDGEFAILNAASQTQPGMPGGGGAGSPGGAPGGRATRPLQPGFGGMAGNAPGASGLAIGGIQGVRSKSEEQSIRSYRGATRYDQWVFTFNNVQRPGGAMPMAGQGGTGSNPNNPRGGPGGGRGPGNRGGFPPNIGPGGGGPGGVRTTPPGSQGQPPGGRPPGSGRGPGGRGGI